MQGKKHQNILRKNRRKYRGLYNRKNHAPSRKNVLRSVGLLFLIACTEITDGIVPWHRFMFVYEPPSKRSTTSQTR
uniref:Uncharacterized protein n=1 Tax=Anopheles funestus TaxID=62324 RepID=A0A4Y0BKB1_ANOFN